MEPRYYQVISSKMEKTLVFMAAPHIAPWIPETLIFNQKNLQWMLKKYSMVVFKPDVGGGGNMVGMIYLMDKEDKLYKIHYKNEIHEKLNQEKVYAFIYNLDPRRVFILQKGIELLKAEGKIFDTRIMMQRLDNDWEVTGIVSKTAPGSKIVTNRTKGGKGRSFRKLLQLEGYTEKRILELEDELYMIGYEAAKVLTDKYPHLRELGLDVGLDNIGRPWIFEVNTKPKYKLFKIYKDKSIYHRIDKNHQQILAATNYYLKNGRLIEK